MKKMLMMLVLLLIMPVIVSASNDVAVKIKDSNMIKLTETKWESNNKEIVSGTILDKNPTIESANGSSEVSFIVTIQDGNGNNITDDATLGLIKSLMVYEVDKTKTYTKEEAKKLKHYNDDFELTESSNKLVFKYKKVLKENDKVTLFNYIVIPNDLTPNELNLLNNFQIVIEPVIDKVAQESTINNPTTGQLFKLSLLIILLSIAVFALYLIYKKEEKKAGLMVILFALVLTGSRIINTKAETQTMLVNKFGTEASIVTNTALKLSSSETEILTDPIVGTGSSDSIKTDAIITNGINPILTNINTIVSKPGISSIYRLWVHNTGQSDINLTNIIYNNVSGTTSPKKCTAIEGTSQSAVDSICNKISYRLVLTGTHLDGSENSIDVEQTTEVTDFIIKAEESSALRLLITHGLFENMVDGPFKVEFGDIDLIYSDGTKEYKVTIDDVQTSYKPQTGLTISSSETSSSINPVIAQPNEFMGLTITPSNANIDNSGYAPKLKNISAKINGNISDDFAYAYSMYDFYLRNDGNSEITINSITFNNVDGKNKTVVCTSSNDNACSKFQFTIDNIAIGINDSTKTVPVNYIIGSGQSLKFDIGIGMNVTISPSHGADTNPYTVQYGDVYINYTTSSGISSRVIIEGGTIEVDHD